MKLLTYKDIGQDKQVAILFDDLTYASTIVKDNSRPKSDLIKDAFILLKNADKLPYDGDTDNLEEIKLDPPRPTRMEPDFYTFKGLVYDQYGDILQVPIDYTIQGTDKVKITDGNLVEEEVQEDTPYTIVAKVGDLEEKQERTLYKKVEPGPERMTLEDSLNDLKKQAETLGMELTQSKLQGIQERQIVQSLGKELAKTRVDNIQKDSAIQALGRELSMVKIQLITMKGGGK